MGPQVCSHVLQVTYDPALVTYEDLLKVFWRHIDPCVENGQGNDRGSQYRTGIYCHTPEQRHVAEASKRNLQVVTKMQDAEVGPPPTRGVSYFARASKEQATVHKKG